MCGKTLLREGELMFLRDAKVFLIVSSRPLGGRHAAVIPALPEEYDASMPIGAYYPKREVSANPSVPRGLSHYPQHIIAQAEAQKGQQQQGNGSGSGGPSSSSSSQRGGSTLAQNATQSNHLQISLTPASSSKGLNIQHYQPIQQTQAPSQSSQKRTTRSSNASASSASRSTRVSARGSQREQQEQQQKQPISESADTSMSPVSEVMPTTFAGIMSQFPVPGLAETPHPAGS